MTIALRSSIDAKLLDLVQNVGILYSIFAINTIFTTSAQEIL